MRPPAAGGPLRNGERGGPRPKPLFLTGEVCIGPEIEACTPWRAPGKGRCPGGGRGAEAGKLYCCRPEDVSVESMEAVSQVFRPHASCMRSRINRPGKSRSSLVSSRASAPVRPRAVPQGPSSVWQPPCLPSQVFLAESATSVTPPRPHRSLLSPVSNQARTLRGAQWDDSSPMKSILPTAESLRGEMSVRVSLLDVESGRGKGAHHSERQPGGSGGCDMACDAISQSERAQARAEAESSERRQRGDGGCKGCIRLNTTGIVFVHHYKLHTTGSLTLPLQLFISVPHAQPCSAARGGVLR